MSWCVPRSNPRFARQTKTARQHPEAVRHRRSRRSYALALARARPIQAERVRLDAVRTRPVTGGSSRRYSNDHGGSHERARGHAHRGGVSDSARPPHLRCCDIARRRLRRARARARPERARARLASWSGCVFGALQKRGGAEDPRALSTAGRGLERRRRLARRGAAMQCRRGRE